MGPAGSVRFRGANRTTVLCRELPRAAAPNPERVGILSYFATTDKSGREYGHRDLHQPHLLNRK